MPQPRATANDWETAEARRYAAICRKHGLKVRIVRSRLRGTYLAVYHDAQAEPDHAFWAKHTAAKREALAAGWRGSEMVCRIVDADDPDAANAGKPRCLGASIDILCDLIERGDFGEPAAPASGPR